jgi:hypothetical protein
MSTDPPIRERRRGERVLIRIPIILFGVTKDNRHATEQAETAVVSRTGALVRSRTAFKPGSTVDLTNQFTKELEKCRIVWVSEQLKQGMYDIGIEMMTPRDEFWGIKFPPRSK